MNARSDSRPVPVDDGASIIGLNAQPAAGQHEFAEREHVPYPLISDSDLQLARTMRLPTFEAAGMRLYKRLTMIALDDEVKKVFYPVFPPEQNAAQVLAWLLAGVTADARDGHRRDLFAQ